MLNFITRERALVFRITHYKNVKWILEHGLYCKNSSSQDPNFIPIGRKEIIDRRTKKVVDEAPRGVLADYVPFYFTPRTPMLMNVKSGYLGLQQWPMNDVAILVSSLHQLAGRRIVIADRNAASATAEFTSVAVGLSSLPWELWRASDFRRDEARPDKVERYMAEALIYGGLEAAELTHIACYTRERAAEIALWVKKTGLSLEVTHQPGWYC